MTIDFLHLYCKCPHCTTMFRAAVSDIDASDGWVKCGHCRKVFDCRDNEIKPADFISADEPGENDSKDKSMDVSDAPEDGEPGDDQLVPQISLFDEPESLKKSSEASADSNASPDVENISAQATGPQKEKLPPVAHAPASESPDEGDGAHSLSMEKRSTQVPGSRTGALQANQRTAQVTSKIQGKPANQGQHQSALESRLNFTKPQASGFSASILAKAQSWKKQRNRFKKTKAFPKSLIAVVLFAALIWQIAIVNYTKLSQYSLLSAPLKAVCSIVTCNHAEAPKASGFEILHASVRRHTSIPNVMTISAKLINFSDENKLMPTLRLDLTNTNNAVIASRTITLPENPQFTDPALSELAPGQDVQLMFNINNPNKSAHGFQLSLVSD